jgi:hypothetical protein
VRGFTATTRNLFSGHIVSGISHPQEADYIRAKGGVMVHVHNRAGKGWPDHYPLGTKLFDICYQTSDEDQNEKSIASYLIPLIRTANKRAA